MRDFVQDDHLRGVSVTKISVQIFTVPSLVRQYICNDLHPQIKTEAQLFETNDAVR